MKKQKKYYNAFDKDDFIKKLDDLYPNRNYKVIGEYINMQTPILVKDSYGECYVYPQGLTRGSVPSIITAIDKTQYFINKSKEIHGDQYTYEKSIFTKSRNKITISCKKHGDFEVTYNNHITKNTGCPKCARERSTKSAIEKSTGWRYNNWEEAAKKSKNFDSFKFYIAKFIPKNEYKNIHEEFYKVGKTFQNTDKRLKKIHVRKYYDYEIIEVIEDESALYISNLEDSIKHIFKHHKFIPRLKFKGSNECFIEIDLKYMNSYIKFNQEKLRSLTHLAF